MKVSSAGEPVTLFSGSDNTYNGRSQAKALSLDSESSVPTHWRWRFWKWRSWKRREDVSEARRLVKSPPPDHKCRSMRLPDESTNAPDESPKGSEGDTSMLLQPDTRPITAEQLVNEVKGIYSGLLMVEKKCVEITTQRAQAGTKLSNDQWQALITLHRTILHEHHDFFLASQQLTASPALRRLATKYTMPARMWRNGIHVFLELLQQQLPESYDHMLAFVYITYSMMALLKESVPSFLGTWIECLGDLARYRMAIEEVDMCDREIWSNVARTWYNKAADRSPNVGRIQHHLAVLARPNAVMQLFYYSKALVAVVPFVNARESVMLLFSPFLDYQGPGNGRPPDSTSTQMTDPQRGTKLVESVEGQVNTSGRSGDWKSRLVPRLKHALLFLANYVTPSAFCGLGHSGASSTRHCRRISSYTPSYQHWVSTGSLSAPNLTRCLLPLLSLLSPAAALPIDKGSTSGDVVGHESSATLQTLLTILFSWGPSSAFATLVVSWIVRRAPADPVRVYGTSALISGIGAFMFGDVQAAAAIRYPTLGAGMVLHVLYTRATFPEICSRLPLLAFLVAAGLGADGFLCHLSAPSQGVDSGLYVALVLPSFWLVQTVTYLLRPVVRRIRYNLVLMLDDTGLP